MLQPRTSRAVPRIGTAFGTALALLALSGEPASAAGSSLYGEGLHVSAGALVDPDGRTWVADHNGGFCRMTASERHHPRPDRASWAPRRARRSHLPRRPAARRRHRPGRGRPARVRRSRPRVGEQRRRGRAHPGRRVAELGGRPRPLEPQHPAVRVPGHHHHERRPRCGRPASASALTTPSTSASSASTTSSASATRPATCRIVEIVGQPRTADGAQIVAAGRDADGEHRRLHRGGRRPARPRTRTPACSRARRVSFDGLDADTAIGAMYYDLATTSSTSAPPTGLTEADAGIDTVIQVGHPGGRRHASSPRASPWWAASPRPPDGNLLRPRRPGAAGSGRAPRSPAACSTSACPAPGSERAARRRRLRRPRAPHRRPHAHLHGRAATASIQCRITRQRRRHGLGRLRRRRRRVHRRAASSSTASTPCPSARRRTA